MVDPKISITRTLKHEDSKLSGIVTKDTGGITRWGVSQKCLDGDTMVLTSNLEWVKMSSLKIGDELIGFDEHPEIHGKLRLRRFKRSKVLNINKLILPSYKITTQHSFLIASEDHLLLRQYGKHRVFEWTKTKDLLSYEGKYQRKNKPKIYLSYGISPWKVKTDYDSGYLSGILDGEGCISFSCLSIYQNDNICFEKIIKTLDKNGYNYSLIKRKNKSGKINNKITFKTQQSMGFLKIIGELRPERLISKAVNQLIGRSTNSKYNRLSEITDVEFIGDHEVYAIETETKTLLANGFYSHNSYPALDVKNLSLDKAIEIYKKDYFSKMRLERVKDQEVADAIFDYGVNAGINRAMVTAREAAIICMSGFKSASYIAEANIYDLINASNVKIFLETFADLRKKYYISLATRNATKYEKYLKGWLRRADTYLPKKEINV